MGTDRTPVQLIAAAWPDPRTANRVVRNLGDPADRGGVVEMVSLVLGRDGRLRIRRDDPTDPGAGATISGLLGAALGVLTGGPGWLLLGGSILETLAAAAGEAGLPQGPLREFGQGLHLGDSAIIAVVATASAAGFRRELATLAAEVLLQPVDPPVLAAIGTRPAVRYAAGDVDGDVIAARCSDRTASLTSDG